MATLTPASAVSNPAFNHASRTDDAHRFLPQGAIARLRAYIPPPTRFYDLPLTRRAAVLILLYADRAGDLRVVLTMRASTLKSCG